MRSRKAIAICATVLAAGVAGCGGSSSGSDKASKPVDPNKAEVSPAGDIPDNQAFVAYAPKSGGYSVKVPEGWSRKTSGSATTFGDKLNSITMEAHPAQVAMTTGGAQRSEVPKLQKAVKGFKSARIATVARPAGPAVLVTYLAPGPPDAVTGKTRVEAVERYVFFHRGKDIVLTLKGPKGADNVDPWRTVTGSLRYTP